MWLHDIRSSSFLTNSVLSAPQQNEMLRNDVDYYTELNQKESMSPKDEDVVKKLQLSKHRLNQCLNERQVHGELICPLPFSFTFFALREHQGPCGKKKLKVFFPSLIYASILCPIATGGRKCRPEDPEWGATEMYGGISEGDGDHDRSVQQNEDCCTAEWLRHGPAQEREGSWKVPSKATPQIFFF